MAHDVVQISARLLVHTARREPEGFRTTLRKLTRDDDPRWTLARRKLDVRWMGISARNIPRAQSRVAGGSPIADLPRRRTGWRKACDRMVDHDDFGRRR